MEVYGTEVVPVIIAILEVLKRSGMHVRFIPVAAIPLGLAAGIFYIAPEDLKKGIFQGIVMALAALGLFSGVKNTVQRPE